MKSLIGLSSLAAFSLSLAPVAKAEVSGVIFCEDFEMVTQHVAISNNYFMALCTNTEEFKPTFWYLGGSRSDVNGITLLEAEVYTMHDYSMSAENLGFTYEFSDECFTEGPVTCEKYQAPRLNIYQEERLIDSELLQARWTKD